MRKAITKTTVAAAAVLSIAASGVYAATSNTTEADRPFGTPRSQITSIQGDQRAAFAVLRRAETAGDTIPRDVQSLLAETDVTGKNLDLARMVPSSRGPAWVIPGDDAICLALPDPIATVGLACATTETAAKDGAFAALVDTSNPSVPLVGIVLPDGATATAVYSDHEARLSPSADGVVLEVLSHATAVRVDGPASSRTYELPSAEQLAGTNR